MCVCLCIHTHTKTVRTCVPRSHTHYVYHCVDSTNYCSCRLEGGGGSWLGYMYNHLRQAVAPDCVDMIMFLMSNPDLIPEITQFDHLSLLGGLKLQLSELLVRKSKTVVEVQSDRV